MIRKEKIINLGYFVAIALLSPTLLFLWHSFNLSNLGGTIHLWKGNFYSYFFFI